MNLFAKGHKYNPYTPEELEQKESQEKLWQAQALKEVPPTAVFLKQWDGKVEIFTNGSPRAIIDSGRLTYVNGRSKDLADWEQRTRDYATLHDLAYYLSAGYSTYESGGNK